MARVWYFDRRHGVAQWGGKTGAGAFTGTGISAMLRVDLRNMAGGPVNYLAGRVYIHRTEATPRPPKHGAALSSQVS